MTDYVGDKVGAVVNTLQSTPMVANALKGGQEHVLIRDTFEMPTAFAQNDRLSLGKVRYDAYINPVASVIWFDDMGTSITMDVGSTATEDALVAAQDVATAAGSCLLYKSVDVAKFASPLWEVLGLASNPGGLVELFAKFEGGNPGTGTITWQIIGRPI